MAKPSKPATTKTRQKIYSLGIACEVYSNSAVGFHFKFFMSENSELKSLCYLDFRTGRFGFLNWVERNTLRKT